jgi:hypothetical protein
MRALSPGARIKLPAVTSDSRPIPIQAWDRGLRRRKFWRRRYNSFWPDEPDGRAADASQRR